MKLYELFITEMIPLSKTMKLRRAWPPAIQSRYEEIFKHYSNDDKGFRIYFPMTQTNAKVSTPIAIVRALADKGYEVLDYIKGLAIDIQTKKRQMKIGKVIKDAPALKTFINDKRRGATKKEYMTVISRHPHDIAGMSAGRGWTSCMDLMKSAAQGGEYKHYVMHDVKQGTIIAYLVTTDDPDIKNPVARILIKPFLNTKNQKGTGKVIDFILVRDGVSFGQGNQQFKRIIDNWLKEINGNKASGLYCFPNSLYADDGIDITPKEIYSAEEEDLYAAIIKNPKLLQTTKLTLYQLTILIERKPILIRKLKPAVQAKMLNKTGSLITKIQNPTMDQIIIAAKTYEKALEQVNWDALSDEKVIKLIKSYSKQGKDILKYITNPSSSMILEMILNSYDGWLGEGSQFLNLFKALGVLSINDWKKVLDKYPVLVGWFVPGYQNFDKNVKGVNKNLISKKDKELLLNYVFDKSSLLTKNVIQELIDQWNIEFSDEMIAKLLDKNPSLINTYNKWYKHSLSDRVMNKITNYILSLNKNKIKEIIYNFVDYLDEDNITKELQNLIIKIFNKHHDLFFIILWEIDDYTENLINNLINTEDFPIFLKNKIIRYALENMNPKTIAKEYDSFVYLKPSNQQWKKLIAKSNRLGENVLNLVSLDVQKWILKNKPIFARSIDTDDLYDNPALVKWLQKNITGDWDHYIDE